MCVAYNQNGQPVTSTVNSGGQQLTPERSGFMTTNFVAGIAIVAFIMGAVALILLLVAH